MKRTAFRFLPDPNSYYRNIRYEIELLGCQLREGHDSGGFNQPTFGRESAQLRDCNESLVTSSNQRFSNQRFEPLPWKKSGAETGGRSRKSWKANRKCP